MTNEDKSVYLSIALIIGAFVMLGSEAALFNILSTMKHSHNELRVIGSSASFYLISILLGGNAIAYNRTNFYNRQALMGLFGVTIEIFGTAILFLFER
jgi:hypothetical protein